MKRLLPALLVVGLAPPVHAAEDRWAGYTCGFTTVSVDGSDVQIGEVHAGPWAVTDAGGASASSVTMTCIIQINNGAHGAGGTTRTSTTNGGVGTLAETLVYTANEGDDVYVCTRVDWATRKGSHTELVDDDDDPTNGVNCALGTSIESGVQNMVFATSYPVSYA